MLTFRSLLTISAVVFLFSVTTANASPVTSLDRSFGHSGSRLVALASPVDSVDAVRRAKQGRSRILATYQHFGDSGGTALIQLTRSGRLDRSFSRDGVVPNPIGSNGQEVVADIAVDSSDRTYVLGVARPESSYTFAAVSKVTRFLPDGRRDGSFGPNGDGSASVVLPPHDGEVSQEPDQLMLDSQGRVFVTLNASFIGENRTLGWVVRLTSDGIVDTGFAGGGFQIPSAAADLSTFVGTVSQARDGGLLVTGSRTGSTSAQAGCMGFRLSGSGAVDGTFNESAWTAPGPWSMDLCSKAWENPNGSWSVQAANLDLGYKRGEPRTNLLSVSKTGVLETSVRMLQPLQESPSLGYGLSLTRLGQRGYASVVATAGQYITRFGRYDAKGNLIPNSKKNPFLRLSKSEWRTAASPLRVSSSRMLAAGAVRSSDERSNGKIEVVRIKVR